MAISLMCLSRTACKQQALGLSPKVLGAVTPKVLGRATPSAKTPARSPAVSGAENGSPFFVDFCTEKPRLTQNVLGRATPSAKTPSRSPTVSGMEHGSPFFVDFSPEKPRLTQKVLGRATPSAKTPSRSPTVSGTEHGSPFFVDFSTEKPSTLAAGVEASLLRHARASAVAQQELTAQTRPAAEVAHKHFLARRNRVTFQEEEEKQSGVLLGRPVISPSNHPPADAPRVEELDTYPVLLGRRSAYAPSPAPSAPKSDGSSLSAAQSARSAFLARQKRIEGRTSQASIP